MNDYSLNQTQVAELEKVHRNLKDKRQADRVKCILALADGWPLTTIHAILRLDEKTCRTLFAQYSKNGIESLLNDNYQKNAAKLIASQMEDLRQHLRENTYTDCKQIVAYVKNKFNIAYSISGMTDLLHQLGFSYKKPKHVPGKQDPEKQREFLAELDELEAQKKTQDPILYGDATHPHHNSTPAYGWIEKGVEKELKANCGRQRLNINGAIDRETLEPIAGFYETINAQTTIEFFKKIEAKYPLAETIYLIVDNARYYRSKLVKIYLETSRIKLIFLPPYSPNLNLIERYWKFFHKKVTNNQYYATFAEFKEACASFFRKRRLYLPELRTLLAPNFHIAS